MAGAFLRCVNGLLVVAAAGLAAPPSAAPAPQQDCPVPENVHAFEPELSRTIGALASGKEVVVVAIGGASTLGGTMGSLDLAWPARLAAALAKRFPAARISVVNRGVARETTQDMAARLDRDALALKPALVIWETGTVDAVRGADLDEFRQAVQAGLDRLRAAGTEVVLMDMQFSRLTHAVINIDRYVTVLREMADANDVPLFRRHDIMRHWAESGVLDLRVEDREKRRRVAVRLHDCIGRAMADFILRGARPPGAAPGRRQ